MLHLPSTWQEIVSVDPCSLTPVSEVVFPFEGLELSRLKILSYCMYPGTSFENQTMGSLLVLFVLMFVFYILMLI